MKTLSSLLLALSILPVSQAPAQIEAPQTYVLKTGSSFATGCFGSCACPIVEQPMSGIFTLRRTSIGPLFTSYDVLDVRWTLPNVPQSTAIVGSGTYRVGGEFAVQHQMILDLSAGQGPKQHFDSGLIPGGGTFPVIDIKLSIHGEQACVDTVLHVIAVPTTTTSDEGTGASTTSRIRTVTPSPFRDRVGFVVSLGHADRVQVAIYDTQGRVVRELARGDWSAGDHPLDWDGRSEEGSDCAAGLYLVGARVGSERFVTRVVRIR